MAVAPIAGYPMPTEPELPENRVGWSPDPHRAVLLVHDMQQYFVDPFSPGQEPVTTLVENIALLRHTADAHGVPVVYTAQPGGMSREQRGLLRDFWGPGMSTSPEHRRIVEPLAARRRDTVVTKWRYSAFHRTGLRELFDRLGRDQVIVCGVYANLGCLLTAVDAFTLDIQPFLAADALADFSLEEHRRALGYAARSCARVLSTARVREELGAPRG
ncbi:isochorismatase family protein [Actinophytocola xanthii]|nr:isochorismatase family protein [Actinophytocola xanthii]